MVLIWDKIRPVLFQTYSCFTIKVLPIKLHQRLLNDYNTKVGVTKRKKGAHQCSPRWRDLRMLSRKIRHRSSFRAEQTAPGRLWLPRVGRTAGRRACIGRNGVCTAKGSWAFLEGTEPYVLSLETAAQTEEPVRPWENVCQQSPPAPHPSLGDFTFKWVSTWSWLSRHLRQAGRVVACPG